MLRSHNKEDAMTLEIGSYITPDDAAQSLRYGYQLHNKAGDITITLYALRDNMGPLLQEFLPEIATDVLQYELGLLHTNIGEVKWKFRSGCYQTDMAFTTIHGDLYRIDVKDKGVLEAERLSRQSRGTDLIWHVTDYERVAASGLGRLSETFRSEAAPHTVFFLQDNSVEHTKYIPCVPAFWSAAQNGSHVYLLVDADLLCGALRVSDDQPVGRGGRQNARIPQSSFSEPLIAPYITLDGDNQPLLVSASPNVIDLLRATRAKFVPITLNASLTPAQIQFTKDNLGYGYCQGICGVEGAGPNMGVK